MGLGARKPVRGRRRHAAGPHAAPSEGAADLLVCLGGRGRLSRWRAAQLFLAMESGHHLDARDEVQCYKVRRVRLLPPREPGAPARLPSHLQLSGQEMRCAAVEVEVLTGVATMRWS